MVDSKKLVRVKSSYKLSEKKAAKKAKKVKKVKVSKKKVRIFKLFLKVR